MLLLTLSTTGVPYYQQVGRTGRALAGKRQFFEVPLTKSLQAARSGRQGSKPPYLSIL